MWSSEGDALPQVALNDKGCLHLHPSPATQRYSCQTGQVRSTAITKRYVIITRCVAYIAAS